MSTIFVHLFEIWRLHTLMNTFLFYRDVLNEWVYNNKFYAIKLLNE